jgi:DNA-binding response OmpR family regulator
MLTMCILLIEDDVMAAEYLAKGLSESGHVFDLVADSETGLTLEHSTATTTSLPSTACCLRGTA